MPMPNIAHFLRNAQSISLIFASLITFILQDHCSFGQACHDDNQFCSEWSGAGLCNQNEYVQTFCRKSCNQCRVIRADHLPEEYNPTRLSVELAPAGFLLGIWREEFEGKARFPTMPTFSYGEQLDFSIADMAPSGRATLNYTAHAWGHNTREELHSEAGYITSDGRRLALTTVMSNGFTTIEEGAISPDGALDLTVKDISRISFSRDLPVTGMTRKWFLLNPNVLQQVLFMSTITHPLQEHTRITYKKIYP